MNEFATFGDFLNSGLQGSVNAVSIGGVIYRQRDAAPMHQDYRYQDGAGKWWSPDYYVIVAGGQSNMVGGADGAPQVLDPDVMMYDFASGTVRPSFYANSRNNLYLPMANELSEQLGRPVLVVSGAVSGSRIDTWLESGTGNNWARLDAAVSAALAQVGQDHVDSFLWLQGESDFPISTPDFVSLLTEFIGQVRSTSWAGDAMAMLIGELSREGVHATQNQAMQVMELAMRNDALLRFVSSTGLTSQDLNGVHFDGPSLVEYGHRFFSELMEILDGTPDAGIGNTAPYLAVQPGAPTSLTLSEGEELRLSPELFFADAEGDDLWLYGSQSRRSVYFLDNDSGDLVIRPRYDAAGSYTLRLYASDGELDGPLHYLTVTVLDATPGVRVWNTTFTKEYFGARDAETAMAMTPKSRGLDITSQSVMPLDGSLDVTKDNLAIRGGADVSGLLVMSGTARTLTLAGSAAFDVLAGSNAVTVKGNLADNVLTGGSAVDRLYGGDGNDLLLGGGGSDYMYGDGMADTLVGEVGDDRLYGGSGNDMLIGGVGKNQSWGGAGEDVFVFSVDEKQCLIRDFVAAEDQILVQGFAGVTSYSSLLAESDVLSFRTSSVYGVRFTIDGDQLQIYNVTLADLTADRFLFG